MDFTGIGTTMAADMVTTEVVDITGAAIAADSWVGGLTADSTGRIFMVAAISVAVENFTVAETSMVAAAFMEADEAGTANMRQGP
jgi:hypothetical protein